LEHPQIDRYGCAFLIPAFNPGHLLALVVRDLRAEIARARLSQAAIVLVNDGCTDGSFDEVERSMGSDLVVLRHGENRGKGAALMTGLNWARENHISVLVTLDADGQHPPGEAVRLLQHEAPAGALVLGVRDLAAAGAPLPNQRSNAFSNRVLSLFGGVALRDTQCGLRRYPVEAILALGARHPGYAFESDVVLRAARLGLPIVHVNTEVHYPQGAAGVSHFDSVLDPSKIVLQVVRTTLGVPHHSAFRRWTRRFLVTLLLCGLLLKVFC
jgi:glycosyltransferase involved in cell wall biosynthesis